MRMPSVCGRRKPSSTTVEQLALGSDDAALDRALQARRAAEDKLAALNGAAAKIGEDIADVEAEIERVIGQRMRVETSAAVLEMANRLEVVFGDFENVARALEDADVWRTLIVPSEAGNVKGFMGLVRQQLQKATAITLAAFKAHAAAVLAGTARPGLPVAAPPPKLAFVPAEPMVTLYVTKNIRFINSEGGVTVCGQDRWRDLPARIGEMAIAAAQRSRWLTRSAFGPSRVRLACSLHSKAHARGSDREAANLRRLP
jgi:hypothetical protein